MGTAIQVCEDGFLTSLHPRHTELTQSRSSFLSASRKKVIAQAVAATEDVEDGAMTACISTYLISLNTLHGCRPLWNQSYLRGTTVVIPMLALSYGLNGSFGSRWISWQVLSLSCASTQSLSARQ